MKEQISVLVETKQSQERITAIIDMYLTNDPQSPLEIKIFSWDNMLLLFNSRITPEMIAEMCSKLLMANIKPERLPELLEKLIQTSVGASRSFYLAADDDETFYLEVTDFCDDEQFPRFSLPVKRCNFEEVAKELENHLRNYRKEVDDLSAKITNSEEDFEQEHRDLVLELEKQTQFSETIEEQLMSSKQAAESEIELLNKEVLKFNEQIAVKDVENSSCLSQIAQLSEETMTEKATIEALTEKLHKTQLNEQEVTESNAQTSELLQQTSEELAAIEDKHEAKLLQLKDAENEVLTLNQKLAEITNSLDSNQVYTEQRLTDLESEITSTEKENEDLKVLAGKLASKVEDMTEKEVFYQEEMQHLEEENEHAILSLQDIIAKNDMLEEENKTQSSEMRENARRLEETVLKAENAEEEAESQLEEIGMLEGENQALKKELGREKQRADDAEAELGNRMYSKLMTERGSGHNGQSALEQPSLHSAQGFNGSSIMSEYRDILQNTARTSAASTEPTFKQFDMSKFLKDLVVPKPARDNIQDSVKDTLSNLPSSEENEIRLSPSTKSSISEETRNIVSKYVKNQVTPKDLEVEVSSTSEDLLFRVMATVPKCPEVDRRMSHASEISEEIIRGEEPLELKDDSQLRYYMDLLNEEIE